MWLTSEGVNLRVAYPLLREKRRLLQQSTKRGAPFPYISLRLHFLGLNLMVALKEGLEDRLEVRWREGETCRGQC